MKKGFTLIEILGIITVLAVVLLVTFPVLNNSLKKMRENTTNNFTNNLKSSAETYIELNRKNYQDLDKPGTEITITIQDLYDANLLKGQIQNIDTNDKIKVIVGTDLILRYYYNGEQIGVEKEIDDSLSREIALIKENLSITTPDGIYYYTEQGNLEDNANAIYLTRNWKKPYGNVLIHNHQLISGCIQMNNKNYDYYKGEITELTYPCSTKRGENLVPNGDLSLKNNTNFSTYTYMQEEGTNGYLSKTTSTNPTQEINNYVPVDVYNKSYEMGMTARTNNLDSKYYIGFKSYDVDRLEISPAYVLFIPNTLTTLARDLNDGDEYIYITDLTNWDKTTTYSYYMAFIFWNYKDSTGYEYPPLTYSRNISGGGAYAKEGIDEENNRIKLNAPWNRGYIPAGTQMSQRASGGVFIYNIKSYGSLTTSWQDLSTTESGLAYLTNVYGYNAKNFWHGTRYIKPAWYNNYTALSNVTVDYKDIYVREVIE